MRILVTGAAGFIGFHLCRLLLENEENEVVGIDNLNDYYDVKLKHDRLDLLGIKNARDLQFRDNATSVSNNKFKFVKLDLQDADALDQLFSEHQFEVVCNLAAQAGVRYSIEAPRKYIESNISGFLNILESCKTFKVDKLVYASSSSVYGNGQNIPFSVDENVDHPESIYAATKKSNELMAHVYSSMYGIKTIGLRFFTVYGPYGRPDMAVYLFTDAILRNQPIKVFNEGNLSRDFTYIDDIIHGVAQIIKTDALVDQSNYQLYNIGNSQPVQLSDFINEIESATGKSAEKKMMPMQAGDVYKTWADVNGLINNFGYKPETTVKNGIQNYVKWFRSYYQI